MRRALKALGVALGALAVLLVAAAGVVYALSERELRRTYAVPEVEVPITADTAAVARGAHLASIATCVLCHGDDLGGAVYADAGPMGIIVGPNLTSGRGGVGGALTDADWVRAIRHGVRRDSTSLIVMPSEVFVHLSDADLGAIIAYLKQLPPVDRELPRTHFRPLGRALLAAGKLPLLVAAKTPHDLRAAAVPPGPTPAYGRYLADVTGCHGCHGYGLSGGRVAGPSNLPPASNLTPHPASAVASWTEADFVRAMRTGRRPDGSAIDPFMPWQVFARMTNGELRALWLYLRGVPPKAFGNK